MRAGVAPWPGMEEATMDWWVWVIIALVALAALTTALVLVQRRRRRGGVIGLGDAGRTGQP